MARRKKSSKRAIAKKHGFRSGLEEDIDKSLKSRGVSGEYEQHKILYSKPATNHTYTPDFKLPKCKQQN